MKEKNNLPMKSADQKDLETIKRVSKRGGQLEAFAFMGFTIQVQIAHILKEMHDDGHYKQLGYKNWEEVCEEYGISRRHSYNLMDNLKIAGPAVIELMYKAGLSTYDQYLMLKGAGEIEDAEFEVLSDDEIKINGKRLSIIDNPKEVLERLCGFKYERDMERRARRDTERELAEKKEELKKKEAKIEAGEKQLTKAQKVGSLLEETPVGNALFQIASYVRQIEAMELSEADEKRKEIYINRVNNDIIPRLVAKFHSVELGQREHADRMEKRNEFESEEDNS